MSLGMKSSSGKVNLQFAKDLNLWVIFVWFYLNTNLACVSLKWSEAEEDSQREHAQDNFSIPKNV